MIIISFILFATSPGHIVTREYPSKAECLAVAEAAKEVSEVKDATYFCVEKAEK